MIVVVDTNIVFSAILNPKGKLNDLLLNSATKYDFFTPTFLIHELISKHDKIKSVSGLSNGEINFLKRILFQSIHFIDPELVLERNLV